ncbi:alpha/beta hydrolase [Actinoplanes bogorensis]|uniref:Alpha/beta hydrolase n=1 Tax=Paractinoplanes bogorensis TaxID=1610840 RepID=A0ABS5YXL5_9ACTN|nr:alpha/beta hydrolase [Actinoplanes bogorensis]MBU2668123.1 alpha/beta hydrolase [Actinoplanes bogorensis]
MIDLVLLPGMLGSSAVWDDVVALLPFPTHPARLEAHDNVPALATAVLAGAPPRFAVAGHSFGAVVAFEMQRQAPERVLGLAVVNGSARGPSDAQRAAWNSWRERTESGEFDTVVVELARSTLPETRPDLVGRNAAMGHAMGAAAFLRQLSAQLTRPDSVPGLPAIGVPTVAVAGALDQICPPALQHEIAGHVPGARLITLPGTGHMSPLENPVGVAGALRAGLLGA